METTDSKSNSGATETALETADEILRWRHGASRIGVAAKIREAMDKAANKARSEVADRKSGAADRSSDDLCGGQIHPPRTMFLRVHCGEAKAGKLKYEMAAAIAGMPIVESKQTGKWFTLSWQVIIEMAVKAGIDEPPNDPSSATGLGGDDRKTETKSP